MCSSAGTETPGSRGEERILQEIDNPPLPLSADKPFWIKFRFARHAGAIPQLKFKLSNYPTKRYQSGQAEDSYWKLPTEERTLIQELLVSGQISKGDFFQLSRLGLCLFGLFQVQPHVGKELY